MLELHEHLHNEDRIALLDKGMAALRLEHEKEVSTKKRFFVSNGGKETDFKAEPFLESEHKHQRLFVNNNGLPYSKQTIQKYLSEIRTEIRRFLPNWYYRMHDLRSTFATHWLKEQATKRYIVFDLLMQELAAFMGHESTVSTEKYINFMNDLQAKLGFAVKKNKAAQRAMKVKG
jgi:integrase